MPTGYTSEIANGISFEKFVLRCARAFGALVEMRDESMDAPIPKKFEPSDYHTKELQKAKEKLKRCRAMTMEQAREEADKEYEKNLAAHERAIKKMETLKAKYEDMLAKVRAWVPPSKDHQELKNFMEKQIEDSISFDCNLRYYEENPPEKITGADWKKMRIENAQDNIAYHTKEQADETGRSVSRSKWVQQLRESLKKK